MLLGTVILLAFITPKSSFPFFPLSPLFPSYLPTIICKHTLPHTHTHAICHITRAARPWISGRAGDLWCIYFGWEERIWFNFCLFEFILLLCPGVLLGLAQFSDLHTNCRCRGAEFSITSGYCRQFLKNIVTLFYLFFSFTVMHWKWNKTKFVYIV